MDLRNDVWPPVLEMVCLQYTFAVLRANRAPLLVTWKIVRLQHNGCYRTNARSRSLRNVCTALRSPTLPFVCRRRCSAAFSAHGRLQSRVWAHRLRAFGPRDIGTSGSSSRASWSLVQTARHRSSRLVPEADTIYIQQIVSGVIFFQSFRKLRNLCDQKGDFRIYEIRFVCQIRFCEVQFVRSD